jgi:AraC-like DNA-binding protein
MFDPFRQNNAGPPHRGRVEPSPASAATDGPVAHIRRTFAPGDQRVGPLAEIPGLLRELGLRPAAVLRRAGLPSRALNERDSRIPFATAGRLLAICTRITGRPDFALLAAQRWRLAHIGLVGELMASCATVGQALECFAAFHWMNASGAAVFLRPDDGFRTFGYAIYEPGMTEGVHEAYDLTMAIGVQMLRELTGNPAWAPLRVHLARPRPADVAPYRRFFRAPVLFNSVASRLHLPARDEARALATRNDDRRRELLAATRGHREAVLPQLRRAVRVALLFGLSADDLAATMHMSPRTLNRRIQACGTTLRHTQAEVRFEVARQLLRDTTLPVAEVAQALGYSEASPFVRAFSRWSGTTPQRWRTEQR